MDLSFFLAKRIIFNSQRSFSRFIIRLAIAATAISVAAMIITLSMVNGFQRTVAEKVFSFWGHARIQNLVPVRSMMAEEESFRRSDSLENAILHVPGIAHLQAYATKSVVIKTKENFEGVLLKGVDNRFNSSYFAGFMRAGKSINFSDSGYSKDILLSEPTASQLQVKTGDTIQVFFIRGAEDIRTRPLVVSGIYKTGIEEYDKNFAIADIRFLRRLNLWDSSLVGGYELWVSNLSKLDTISQQIQDALPQGLQSVPIRRVYPNIFDWLSIQDQTKLIVIVVMTIVAIINLITCLLILVMERTRMVGVLKAAGMADTGIQTIFWYYASWIAGVGIAAGLGIGLGVSLLQQLTGFIKMDETAYYVSAVPVHIIWWQVLAIALVTFGICFAALRLPLLFVNRVSPVKAVQFR